MFPLKNRWAVLVLLFLARTSTALLFLSLAPLLPQFVRMWGISYAQAGLLISVAMFAGIGLALPTGLLARRFGDRNILLCALAFQVAGSMLLASADGFALGMAGRTLIGVGLVFLNVQSTKIVTDWFIGKELATGLSVYLASWPLGMGLALLIMVPLSEWVGWRTVMLVLGVLAAIFLVLVFLLFGDSPAADSQTDGQPALSPITGRELALVLLAGLIWGLPNASFLIFNSFTPGLLTTRGLDAAMAGFAVSLVSFVFIPVTPIGGIIVDKTGRVNLIIVTGLFFSAALIAGIATGALLWLGVILYGVSAMAWPGGIMSLPGQVLSAQSRATGFGVFYTVFYLCLTALPPLGGWVRDITGAPEAPLYLAALFMVLPLPILLALRMLQRRWA